MFFRASLPPVIFRRITSWDALLSITSDLDATNNSYAKKRVCHGLNPGLNPVLFTRIS